MARTNSLICENHFAETTFWSELIGGLFRRAGRCRGHCRQQSTNLMPPDWNLTHLLRGGAHFESTRVRKIIIDFLEKRTVVSTQSEHLVEI